VTEDKGIRAIFACSQSYNKIIIHRGGAVNKMMIIHP
jgi:hypothetical protein